MTVITFNATLLIEELKVTTINREEYTMANNLFSLVKAMAGGDGVATFRDEAEDAVKNLDDLISPGDRAVIRKNTSPPGQGVNTMMKTMPLPDKVRLVPTVLGTMNTVSRSAEFMKRAAKSERTEAEPAFWDLVREVAKGLGALDVGFISVDDNEIFEQFEIPYRNAVVFTFGMDKDAIDTAPSFDALTEVLGTYGSLGKVANALTEYLRGAGYGAYPGFAIGGLVDYVRVAEQAGLGAIGYHGMLISPQEGTRQRINLVFTNMDIPEPEENPHLWVREVCAMCQNCVRSCPPGAIHTDGEVDEVTGRKQTLHYEHCLEYYGANQGCAVCVKVCPFSNIGYEKVKEGYFDLKDYRESQGLETQQETSYAV